MIERKEKDIFLRNESEKMKREMKNEKIKIRNENEKMKK